MCDILEKHVWLVKISEINMIHTTKKSMPYMEQDACPEGNDLLRKENGVGSYHLHVTEFIMT